METSECWDRLATLKVSNCVPRQKLSDLIQKAEDLQQSTLTIRTHGCLLWATLHIACTKTCMALSCNHRLTYVIGSPLPEMLSVLPAVHCCYRKGHQSSTALAYLVCSSPHSLAEPQEACQCCFDSATRSTRQVGRGHCCTFFVPERTK